MEKPINSTCPSELELYTADEIAECFDGIGKPLYAKLWKLLSEAKNPTPLGGDGSNGTVETPDGRLDSRNDDKMVNLWVKLTQDERGIIIASYEKEHGTIK